MAYRIMTTASAVPHKIVTNDDLAKILETSNDWIESRTGIIERHIAVDENTSDLCYRVAEKLLAQANVAPEQIKAIIVATMTPDYYTPATAAIVQGKLGATHAFAFDISAACSGFTYALSVARGYIQLPTDYVLVIGGEVTSKVLDWSDRSSAVLFGDGAAGVLLQGTPEEADGWYGEQLLTIGRQSEQLTSGYTPATQANFGQVGQTHIQSTFFQMAGQAIYQFSTRQVPRAIEAAVLAAGLSLDQVDHFLVHQANARLITKMASQLNQPLTKFPMNLQHYGNTSAASIPLLLAEQVASGKIKRGDCCVLCGFGGGLTIGIQIIQY
ncbi:beta-ketoacyl-ACP synthase III [Lactobacillus curvatus]|nr:beta-ketoacyl-ACP synthase III [Latilactobacillus curvatus]MSE23080.1 beta-ketoacyl-ACP synthase III [Latilactobacillus curvatus]